MEIWLTDTPKLKVGSMHKNASELLDRMQDWFAAKNLNCIQVDVDNHPRNEEADDYKYDAIASFRPDSLEMMQVEVFATTDGYVGFGLETRERVAQRLGLTNRRSGYASGFEPSLFDLDASLQILQLASDGKIYLLPRVWPLLGLAEVGVCVDRSNLSGILKQLGFVAAENQHAKLVTYAPWC